MLKEVPKQTEASKAIDIMFDSILAIKTLRLRNSIKSLKTLSRPTYTGGIDVGLLAESGI